MVAQQYGFGLSRFAAFQRLSDADDRSQAGVQGGQRPLQHGLIRFSEILAALAMADDHVRTPRLRIIGPEIRRWCRPPSFAQNKFWAPTPIFSYLLRSRPRRRRIREGGADHDLAVSGALHQTSKLIKKTGRLGGSFVHLPIAAITGILIRSPVRNWFLSLDDIRNFQRPSGPGPITSNEGRAERRVLPWVRTPAAGRIRGSGRWRE